MHRCSYCRGNCECDPDPHCLHTCAENPHIKLLQQISSLEGEIFSLKQKLLNKTILEEQLRSHIAELNGQLVGRKRNK